MKHFCLDFYIFDDSFDLENLPLVNIERTFSLFLFPWWLTLATFFTRCVYFHHNWWWEKSIESMREKWIKSIFEGLYVNLRRKFWKFINRTQLTVDNLNTQKVKLRINPCWRHSINQTISLVPSEQNL